jgi:hypothetical protein
VADTAAACILTGADDLGARVARQCEAAAWLACAAHDACPHGVALSCTRDRHPAGELHRDLDGIEWREVAGG